MQIDELVDELREMHREDPSLPFMMSPPSKPMMMSVYSGGKWRVNLSGRRVKDSGIVVSDFITEKDGYLRLTEEEYPAANEKNLSFRKAA